MLTLEDVVPFIPGNRAPPATEFEPSSAASMILRISSIISPMVDGGVGCTSLGLSFGRGPTNHLSKELSRRPFSR